MNPRLYSLSVVDHDSVQSMLSLFQLFSTYDVDGILGFSEPKEAAGGWQRGHPEPFSAYGVKLAEREVEEHPAYK